MSAEWCDTARLISAPTPIQMIARGLTSSFEEHLGVPDEPGIYGIWVEDPDCWRDLCVMPQPRGRPIFIGAARSLRDRLLAHLDDPEGPFGALRLQLQILLDCSGAVPASEKSLLRWLVSREQVGSLEALPSYSPASEACSEWMLENLRITWGTSGTIGKAVALARFAAELLQPAFPISLDLPSDLELTPDAAGAVECRARWVSNVRFVRSKFMPKVRMGYDGLSDFYVASRRRWPCQTSDDVLALLDILDRDWWIVVASEWGYPCEPPGFAQSLAERAHALLGRALDPGYARMSADDGTSR